MQLKGKIALITGASSGIGAAAARELHRAGMKLVLTARRRDRLEELAGELKPSIFLAADITDPGLPERLVEKAAHELGGLHVVVNNAGIIATGTIETIDLQRVSRMVQINVEAAYRVAYVALRFFLRQNSGYLVNISSLLGTKIRPTAGAYAGTKHAIEALTEALRLEVSGTGVAVAGIQPGLVLTELHDHLPEHPSRTLGIDQPLQPEDVARCLRFILEQPDPVRIPSLKIVPSKSSI